MIESYRGGRCVLFGLAYGVEQVELLREFADISTPWSRDSFVPQRNTLKVKLATRYAPDDEERVAAVDDLRAWATSSEVLKPLHLVVEHPDIDTRIEGDFVLATLDFETVYAPWVDVDVSFSSCGEPRITSMKPAPTRWQRVARWLRRNFWERE